MKQRCAAELQKLTR